MFAIAVVESWLHRFFRRFWAVNPATRAPRLQPVELFTREDFSLAPTASAEPIHPADWHFPTEDDAAQGFARADFNLLDPEAMADMCERYRLPEEMPREMAWFLAMLMTLDMRMMLEEASKLQAGHGEVLEPFTYGRHFRERAADCYFALKGGLPDWRWWPYMHIFAAVVTQGYRYIYHQEAIR